MAQAIDNPEAFNQIFNIGADQPYTVNELAFSVASAMNVEPNLIHLPARNAVFHAYSSHEKAQRFFGGRELHSLEEGLARMAAWVKQHGARSSQEFENIEVHKSFPKAWLPEDASDTGR